MEPSRPSATNPPGRPRQELLTAQARITRERDTACRVFALSHDLLGSADESGRFTALNPAWERTLGFSRAALMAQPSIEFVHPADRDATLAQAARLAADGSASVGFENRYAVNGGGWCWLSWRIEAGEGGYDFVAHDITARVAAEQRRHLLANLAEGIDDAVLTKTIDGVITSWNQAAEWLYGFTAAEAIGRSMVDLIVPAALTDEPDVIVERLLRGEGVRQYTTQRRRKDGMVLTVSLTASLLRDGDRKVLGVAVVSHDVSGHEVEGGGERHELDTLAWVGRIRDAIDEGRIVFHTQPIISVHDAPTNYELLCRMISPDGETIPPARFVPVAERYGLIEELDLLAVDAAARELAAGWDVSVNLSTATVGRRHILDVIAEKLHTAGADPSRLTLEITESALMKDIAAAQRFARGITALGCHLALDDFGTGFGGFTYLKRLQIDRLKIDVEFVRDVHTSVASQHVVRAVVALAKGLGLDTVAEGVEDAESFRLVERAGVSHVQGYYIDGPVPLDEVLRDHEPSGMGRALP